MTIVGPLIEKAREYLEAGEKLQSIAFVGNLTTKRFAPVIIDPESDPTKDQSARLIQSSALALEADFVLTIMEAWSLRADKVPQMDAILDKYGSLGASPYGVDVCLISLETRRGVWLAQPQIKPKGHSKKKRTIGTIDFRYYTDVRGRFTHLLPEKEGDEVPTILH